MRLEVALETADSDDDLTGEWTGEWAHHRRSECAPMEHCS
jgi:hypothetical protein